MAMVDPTVVALGKHVHVHENCVGQLHAHDPRVLSIVEERYVVPLVVGAVVVVA
jgi:hypothetical protein